jgi:hypothetical protein
MPLPPAVPVQHQGFATTYRVPAALPIAYVQAEAPPEDKVVCSRSSMMTLLHVAGFVAIGALLYALYKKKKMERVIL